MSCCASSEKESELSPCPQCQILSQPIDRVTPRHTLKKEFRDTIGDDNNYHFCEIPDCNTVYFSSDGLQNFTTEQLINRVTCKDSSPETPLCYCYKITKGDALKEYQASGESTVIQQIEQKMTEISCFCDKSNPRGICCTREIKTWLEEQGIKQHENGSKESSCSSNCCYTLKMTPYSQERSFEHRQSLGNLSCGTEWIGLNFSMCIGLVMLIIFLGHADYFSQFLALCVCLFEIEL